MCRENSETFKNNLSLMKIFRIKSNSKEPATKNGFKDAKTGEDVLKIKKEGYNVAIACRASRLIVLDADVDNERGLDGVGTLANLAINLGDLPCTLVQKTPRGGYHFIYRDRGIINPIGKIGKDVDIKYNGYIMCYPSEINGKKYEFIDGFDENNFYINDLPLSYVNYINGKSVNFSNYKNYTKKAYKNIDFNAMFEQCLFLQFCRDNANALPEPMWHSMISVLAVIENSDNLIHELSIPYPKYSFEETQRKIYYARKFGYAQSCGYISASYPEVCKNCKYNNYKGE